MIVRDATAKDADAICDIVNPVIRDTAVTFTTAEKTPAGVVEDIDTRRTAGHGYFVAEEAGQVLGFASYGQFRGGPGYAHTVEHSIVLGPQARGRGVGRALMRHLEDHAREGGKHSVWAGVSAENPAGAAFHEAIGFERVAVLPEVGFKFGRWMDLILLQKLL